MDLIPSDWTFICRDTRRDHAGNVVVVDLYADRYNDVHAIPVQFSE